MRNNLTPFLFFLLGIVVTVASGQAPAKERGVLSVLHVGQPVTLKASESGYEINTLQKWPREAGSQGRGGRSRLCGGEGHRGNQRDPHPDLLRQ